MNVSKCWKTVFALKVPIARKPKEPEFNSAVIADRLDVVIAELAIVDAAIAGSEVGPRHRFGFYSILRKQIDEITAVRNEVHRPQK